MTRHEKATHFTTDPTDRDAPPAVGTVGAASPPIAIGTLGPEELADLYGYPADLSGPWVRANFITSIDGAVAVDGLSGGLATPADQRIYHLLRSLCDVVLVGSGTALAENYGPVAFDPAVRDRRAEAGLAPVPPIAVVTGSARIPADHRLFGASDAAPIVLIGETADERRVDALIGAGARVIRLPGSSVEPAAIVAALAELHLLRVLCEGGPSLIGSMIEADLVDEFCLTTAPVLAAGRAGRATASPHGAVRRAQHAVLLTDDDGTIATRWVIDRGRP